MADEVEVGVEARRCALCFYKFPEEYADDAVVCGACLNTYPEEAVRLGDPVAIWEAAHGGHDTTT